MAMCKFTNSKSLTSHFCGMHRQASQDKVLTEGEDLREVQVDVPLSVNHSCIDRIAGLLNLLAPEFSFKY
jgi:hypothetical protein